MHILPRHVHTMFLLSLTLKGNHSPNNFKTYFKGTLFKYPPLTMKDKNKETIQDGKTAQTFKKDYMKEKLYIKKKKLNLLPLSTQCTTKCKIVWAGISFV